MRKDAALRDRDAREQFVELFVVADGELQMARVDVRLFAVASRVAGELEHFGGEVLENGGYVDGARRRQRAQRSDLTTKAIVCMQTNEFIDEPLPNTILL